VVLQPLHVHVPASLMLCYSAAVSNAVALLVVHASCRSFSQRTLGQRGGEVGVGSCLLLAHCVMEQIMLLQHNLYASTHVIAHVQGTLTSMALCGM
jgi:hypothetical protein